MRKILAMLLALALLLPAGAALAETYPLIVTLEEGILNGGYGSMVMQYLMQKGYKGNIRNIGIEDQFVEHGSISELRSMLKIDGEHIAASMKQWLENRK